MKEYKLEEIMDAFEECAKQRQELEQENKQLKEELENDIDRYEDTISYQLGFDKGKEYLQQKIDKAIECLKDIRQSTFTKYNSNEWNNCLSFNDDIKPLFEILGDKK